MELINLYFMVYEAFVDYLNQNIFWIARIIIFFACKQSINNFGRITNFHSYQTYYLSHNWGEEMVSRLSQGDL